VLLLHLLSISFSSLQLPWDALRTLLTRVVYGGRVDNLIDARLLHAYVVRTLQPTAYADDAALGGLQLPPPSHNTRAQLLQWASTLPAGPADPRVLGLPGGSELLVRSRAGRSLLGAVNTLLGAVQVSIDHAGDDHGTGGVAARLRAWLAALPEVQKSTAPTTGPLGRFWTREGKQAVALRARVDGDIRALLEVAQGQTKSTNATRALLASLLAQRVPPNWRRFSAGLLVTVDVFVADLFARLAHAGTPHTRLGQLLAPSAYVTATRQAACAAGGWALETVVLEASVLVAGAPISTTLDAHSWVAEGCSVEGARWNGERLELCDDISHQLPPLLMRWRPGPRVQEADEVSVPVYLNTERSEMLFSIALKKDPEVEEDTFYLAGLAIVCSNV
jgi:dynein heavy chain 1